MFVGRRVPLREPVERSSGARRRLGDDVEGFLPLRLQLLHPVAGDRRVGQVGQIGLPQLGDGVLAARPGGPPIIRQRHAGEGQQLVHVEAAQEGQASHAVAVQPEAQAPLPRRLGVDRRVGEDERVGLDGDREAAQALEEGGEGSVCRGQERSVLVARVAIEGDALE